MGCSKNWLEEHYYEPMKEYSSGYRFNKGCCCDCLCDKLDCLESCFDTCCNCDGCCEDCCNSYCKKFCCIFIFLYCVVGPIIVIIVSSIH